MLYEHRYIEKSVRNNSFISKPPDRLGLHFSISGRLFMDYYTHLHQSVYGGIQRITLVEHKLEHKKGDCNTFFVHSLF